MRVDLLGVNDVAPLECRRQVMLDARNHRPRQNRSGDPETLQSIIGLHLNEYEHPAFNRLADVRKVDFMSMERGRDRSDFHSSLRFARTRSWSHALQEGRRLSY